jgi:hypothetical protein
VSTINWMISRLAFGDDLEAFVRAGLGKRLTFCSDRMLWPIGTCPVSCRSTPVPVAVDANRRRSGLRAVSPGRPGRRVRVASRRGGVET